MGISDRRAQGHMVLRREAFECRASELRCRRQATDSRYTLRCAKAGQRLEDT
ncbi:UNVERIFIED_CONTAM: hypothetical protein Sradi_6916800 [Sesamum radiatum]|uniref:Uncharacterized protein n=1 Tax=Sesamum radiatum TaxID=300843 RepID=A0AAW2JGM7_SESRA